MLSLRSLMHYKSLQKYPSWLRGFENGAGKADQRIYALPSMLLREGYGISAYMAFGAVGDERFAYEYGRITAREARATGVHVCLHPF
ncbi:MAG: hypothetical protein CM1200mP14_23390 [Gammaproteobacteria bacterium]|nr:MAG: hypothetical protein CM1200mP14_23390 [Gammaproteobacteria bacterium]